MVLLARLVFFGEFGLLVKKETDIEKTEQKININTLNIKTSKVIYKIISILETNFRTLLKGVMRHRG